MIVTWVFTDIDCSRVMNLCHVESDAVLVDAPDVHTCVPALQCNIIMIV